VPEYLKYLTYIFMKMKQLVITCFLVISSLSCGKKEKGLVVKFPEVSGPEQITSDDKEHLFASYYGINSFNKSETYVTVLETDIKFKLPDENEPATLGLIELEPANFFLLQKPEHGIFSRVVWLTGWRPLQTVLLFSMITGTIFMCL
jgi:hypothetical protein